MAGKPTLMVYRGNRPWMYKDHSPELVGCQFAELVELNLLGEHVQRHRGRPPQSAAALVIVQYGVERRPVPVEEVLVAQRVEKPHPPARVAQQRVRELVQRPQLRLEPHTAYLKRTAVIRERPKVYNVLLVSKYQTKINCHSVTIIWFSNSPITRSPPVVTIFGNFHFGSELIV